MTVSSRTLTSYSIMYAVPVQDIGNFLLKLITFFVSLHVSWGQDVEVLNPFHFPGLSTPFQGIILAIDTPLDTGGFPDLHFSYLYEAAYTLPTNETSYEYPPIIGNRKIIYNIIEEKFTSYGYAGKECLLRAICEAAQYSFQHTGVLGDLIHIILMPSSSYEDIVNDYEDSEVYGREQGHCEKYRKSCSFSLLEKVSEIKNIVKNRKF